MELTVTRRPPMEAEVEIVERKGRGHPDTLADGLAEELSVRYSLYCRERFGAILHHNFDKVGLLGGRSAARLGEGRMLAPVRVLLNGRAAGEFGGEEIPLQDLLFEWATEFLVRELPLIDPDRDIEIHFNVSQANTPGYPDADFQPDSPTDLGQSHGLLSSDSAAVCVQHPLSPVERAVLAIEQMLTADEYRAERPWLGSDIKLLACRTGDRVSMTACVPQVADYVPDADSYRRNLDSTRDDVTALALELLPELSLELTLNTKDDFEAEQLYITALGSCVESGDEGLVGRGNRPSGLISVARSFSGEAACGKNPVFFPGKVYTAAGKQIAERLHTAVGAPIEVWLVAQEGRTLADPWKVVVMHEADELPAALVESTLAEVLGDLPSLTEAMLRNEVRLR